MNDYWCRMSRGSGDETRWPPGRRGSSSTLTTSTPTRSVSIPSVLARLTLRRRTLTTFDTDERLGKLFKANPPTEDAYIYRGNYAHP